MLKVFQIITDYSLKTGGAQRIAIMLHEKLNENSNTSSHLLGLYHHDNPLPHSASMVLSSPYHPLAIFKLYFFLKKYIKKGDILHVHLFPTMLYVSILKMLRLISNKAIATEHSTSNGRRNTLVGKVIDTFTYKGYEKVICISEGTKKNLLEWMPKLESKLKVIYNGTDLYEFNNVIQSNSKKCIILSVGRLHPSKNYERAIYAISKVQDLTIEYWIAGEGEERIKLEKLVTALNLVGKVKLLGHVHDINYLLSQAHIYFAPSLWEGFGLSVVEAMSVGLPVIVSDIEGMREVVACKPACALKINSEDIDSMAYSIEKLIKNPSLREKLGRQSKERAKCFSTKRMVEQYMMVYKSL